MRTIDRYVIRETVMPFLLALTVLTFLFAIRPMMEQAEGLITKGAPIGTVVFLLINLLPQALGVTLPMAFLIGLLIALGRLSADRETVALLACGVSLWRILRPALIMSVVVGGLTLYVMIDGIPAGNKAFVQIVMNLVAQKSAQEIKPGVFYEGFPGKVLFVESVRPDGIWQNVMLATSRENSLPALALANEGQLVIDRAASRVEIILRGVSRRLPGADPGVYDRGDDPTGEDKYSINPLDVFPKVEIIPGIHEMTIAELRADQAIERAAGGSTHNQEIFIQQKFSFPVACLVMGLLGVAVGVHTRKDGKFASFALGLGLIFVYYALMIVFESFTKGGRFPAVWARWVPNLLLGPAALWIIWRRSRNAERSGLPAAVAARLASRAEADPDAALSAPATRPVLVIRMATLGLPRPKLIDLYVTRQYLHLVSLAFVGLLGLFYVSTIVDMSDKLFKPNVTAGMLVDFLWYSTPQYIYFLIPIAILVAVLVTLGAMSKNSELTVLRACGVSFYRLAVPLLLLGAVGSGVLFGLEEYVLASANKKKTAIENVIRERPSGVVDLTNRHWLVGTAGRVYYYGVYDARQRVFVSLSVYEIGRNPYRITRHTFVERARATRTASWTGGPGWTQAFPEGGGAPRDNFQSKSLSLDPSKYFETEQADAQAMTVRQLQQYVRQLKQSGLSVGDYEVDLQRKIAGPLMAIVMTLIALPFGVTLGRRGALYGIGLAIALAFAYQVAFTAFGVMGSSELLPAALAAWAPNLLFLAGALYGLLRVRT